MKRRMVLIVDDDIDIRESLRDAFEDEGWGVQCVEDGRAGLEALQHSEPPCLVVLDLVMPIMSGNELYDAMRADARLARIPVLVSTSDPARAPKDAMVVRKPFDLFAMLKTAADLCDSAHANDA